MRRRTFLGGIAGTVAVATAPVIGRRAAASDKKVLRIGMNAEVLTLDPIKTVYGPDIIIQGMMYARMLRANADRSKVMPALAESWTISDDGKTYTFKLTDAKFSDGTPITAEDVAFSYTRMRYQKDSAYAAPFQALEKTEAAGPKTVVMHLSKKFTPFLTLTEIWNSGIVPKADVEKKGDDEYARNPVSSGPFRFVEWRKGDRVVLERNPNYYRANLPKIDGVELIYVPDDNTRISMLQAGEIDLLMGVPAARVQELIDLKFNAKPEPASVCYEILINHSKEPFNDVRVRQALSLAIDRQAITQTVTAGFGQPGSACMAPVLDYFNKDLPVPARDLTKAKSLLADAGKPNLSFDLVISAGVVDDERTAVLIQSQAAEAGITVNVQKVDSTQEWTRLVDGDYQATLNWWYNETRDPDNALRWAVWGTGDNKSYYTRFNDDKVNQLIEAGAGEGDPEKRRQIYYEIQKIAYDQVAQVVLYYPPFYNAYSPKVKGLNLNPGYQFSTIDEASIES